MSSASGLAIGHSQPSTTSWGFVLFQIPHWVLGGNDLGCLIVVVGHYHHNQTHVGSSLSQHS